MEGKRNVFGAVFEDDNFDNGDDADMFDVEEGELVEEFYPHNGSGQRGGGNGSVENQERQGIKKNKNKKKKRRNKRKNSGGGVLGPYVNDIDRFVLESCRRLKERKSYLVYTAIGCLGIPALSELIKEVDAIQACGGQMTYDGRRYRTGGGVLWSIIKAREPNAYKEIMKKAREFEKQFRQPKSIQPIEQRKAGSSRVIANSSKDGTPANVSEGLPVSGQMQTLHFHSNPERKHISVHERLRRPVSYDDDLLGGAPTDDGTPTDGLPVIGQMQTTLAVQTNSEVKCIPVHDRFRRSVLYDDDLLGGAPNDDGSLANIPDGLPVIHQMQTLAIQSNP